MTNLDAAHEYAKRGWNIFPLAYVLKDGTCSCRDEEKCKGRIGKHPLTANGFKNASTDPVQIEKWWSVKPHSNIGFATGGSGLTVIDIDEDAAKNKHGEAELEKLIAKFGPLPETLTARTGGGGRHIYFATPQQYPSGQNVIAPNIDVRSNSGYVILPNSNHASGRRYEWLDSAAPIAPMPDWITARLSKSDTPKVDISDDEMQADILKEVKEQNLDARKIGILLNRIPADCDYTVWWQTGAVIKLTLGDAGFPLWEDWSKKSSKYNPKIMEQQWTSFVAKGLTAGTLIHYAKTLGGFKGFAAESIEELQKSEEFTHWCYVSKTNQMIRVTDLLELDRESFDNKYKHTLEKGSPSEVLLRSPAFKKVDFPTYWPGESIWVTEDGYEKLNRWRPSGVIAKKGDTKLFVEHVNYLLPKEKEARILLQYLAYQVQHPGKKVSWSVLIEGRQGTGKTYIGQVMSAILGSKNVQMVNSEMLHEIYTHWQKETHLVVINEMMARGKLELMNKLKNMITDEVCQIREMRVNPYLQPNRFNFLFFTNHSNSIIIDDDDRRYCILKSPAEKHPDKQKYYAPLWDLRDNHAPELLYFFENYSLEGFEPREQAPITEGRRELIGESRRPLETFLEEHITAEEYPMNADIFRLSDLIEPLKKFNLHPNTKELSVAFKNLGYQELKRVKETGSRIQLWAVRNYDTYKDLSEGALRQLWLARRDSGPSAGTDEDHAAILKGARQNPVKDREPM